MTSDEVKSETDWASSVTTWDDPEPLLRLGQIWTAHRAGEEVTRDDVGWLCEQVDYLMRIRRSRVDPDAVAQRQAEWNGSRIELLHDAAVLVGRARRG